MYSNVQWCLREPLNATPDDDVKLVETLRNKNDFNIRYYHCFILYSGVMCYSFFLVFQIQ